MHVYSGRVQDMMAKLTDHKYNMVPPKYLEVPGPAEVGKRPLLLRHNPVAR